jgi:iron(III) transport system substrate-binding protein
MRRWLIAFAVFAVSTAACSGGEDGTLRIYTSVTQGTVDAVVDGFQAERPGVDVEVFRAPTGELNARIAAEQREGGLQADVLWLTDPLSMQQYAATDTLVEWTPDGAEQIPPDYREDSFVGTRILTMVMIAGDGVDPPSTWGDLAEPRFAGRIAFPDPGFAGSSFAVLGYFSSADGYGLEFYERLEANGAVQVNAPGEVVTGVAEGRFDAGITLEFSARNAVANGSPISIVWPEDGAIALYSPIAVVDGSGSRSSAEAFVEYVISVDGQQRIAGTGWQPVVGDWDVGGEQVSVDWTELFGSQQVLLEGYRAIFGG